MSRRRKNHGEHVNHERWMVSYADFVTLLFAFFVVMFATANADTSKARKLADAVNQALEEGEVTNVATMFGEVINGKRPPKHGPPERGSMINSDKDSPGTVIELLPSVDRLKEQLKKEIDAGEIRIRTEPRGLVISFSQAALFRSGDAVVRLSSYEAMGKVADVIRKIPNQVRLEGHTDNVPIHNENFASNWDLSAARAIAVLEVLAGRFNVDQHRLAVGGYGEVAPVAANDTEEGRALNRRVDVVVLSQRALTSEPPRDLAAN